MARSILAIWRGLAEEDRAQGVRMSSAESGDIRVILSPKKKSLSLFGHEYMSPPEEGSGDILADVAVP